MPAASILIKPASSNCNINCGYCFYKRLSSNRAEYDKGFMTRDTAKELVAQAIGYADGFVSFAFQGGEPTLAGLDFFKEIVRLQKEYNKKGVKIENTIQTNGTLIDGEWAAFLAENDFLVGLSIDGPRKLNDACRKTADGGGTFERVMDTVSLFRKYHVEFNILSVITDDIAKKASYLYRFYKRNKFRYVQLIPCMDEAGGGVDPELYGEFLCGMFDAWYEDFENGEVMDIRMFSNLAQMAAGYPAEQCGMNGSCTCYFAVEGDGSVYPCDFYCTDEWRLGDVSEGFNALLETDKAKKFVSDSAYDMPECKECPHFSLCRGGCRRWREPFSQGRPGLNYLCPAYKTFFARASDRIMKLGRRIPPPYYRN